jgi:hypothetical protein
MRPSEDEGRDEGLPFAVLQKDGTTKPVPGTFEDRMKMAEYTLAHGGGDLIEPLDQLIEAMLVAEPDGAKVAEHLDHFLKEGLMEMGYLTLPGKEPKLCIKIKEELMRRCCKTHKGN